MKPMFQYDIAIHGGDLEFESFWLPLEGKSIKTKFEGKLYYNLFVTSTQK
jgi:hypothetical protein